MAASFGALASWRLKWRASEVISTSSTPFMRAVITGALRSPSRKKMSWFSRKVTGCPAMDGVRGVVEFPAGPWHDSHIEIVSSPASNKLPAITDAVDRSHLLVGHQHRAVGHLHHVD